MTPAQFLHAMTRGLGRCAQYLETAEDKEDYRPAVLWGCLHAIAFDPQCESRAPYLFALTRFFEDDDYFVTPVAETYLALPPSEDRQFDHLTDLLSCFAREGNEKARDALTKKYDDLLALLRRKRKDPSPNSALFQLETLAVARLHLEKALASDILRDVGNILKQHPTCGVHDFDWLFDSLGTLLGEKRAARLMEKAGIALPSASVREIRRPPAALADILAHLKAGDLAPASLIRFARNASLDEKRELADYILTTPEEKEKAVLLNAFRTPFSPFPGDITPLISYVRAGGPALRDAALAAVEVFRDPRVRDLAFESEETPVLRSSSLCMFITNYERKDKSALLSRLYALDIDREDESGWHKVITHFLEMDAAKGAPYLPRAALLWIYENSLCSCCRAEALRHLAAHRWLTPSILRECLLDARSDIRAFAARRCTSADTSQPVPV